MCGVSIGGRIALAMAMQDIKGCDKELVCILLLITCQVSGMSPYEVKQFVEDQRSFVPTVELLEESRNFTDQAACCIIIKLTNMLVRKEVVSKQWRVRQGLDDAAHEACVT